MNSSGAYVDDAVSWAKRLTQAETRFPGDYGPAMRRLSHQIGVPFRVLWNLHYRTPKAINAADYVNLGNAYEQRELYRQARTAYEPKTALGHLLVRTADFVAGEETRDMSNEQTRIG